MRNNNKLLVILCLIMLTSFGCKKQTDSATDANSKPDANSNVVTGIEKPAAEENPQPESAGSSEQVVENTPKVEAAIKDDACVKALQAKGIDPKAQDKDGKNALFYAENEGCVNALIDAGVDPKVLDKGGRNALFYAANGGVIRALVHAGCDVNQDKSGQKPIYWAKNDDVVRALIEAGAEFNKEAGWTPLFVITSPSAAKALIDAGVDVNARNEDGETALFSIDSGDEDRDLALGRVFMEAGVDINAKNNDGKTALFPLASTSNVSLVNELLNHGADIKVKAKDGTTVLFDATNELSSCEPKMIQMLIDAGADVSVKNKDGKTYIEAAYPECKDQLQDANVIKPSSLLSESEVKAILEEMDVEPSEVNKPDGGLGYTPIFSAHNAQEVYALAAAGADVNYVAGDETPLFSIATECDNADCVSAVKALINAGADVNHVDKDGYTALFFTKRADVARMLIEAGIDIYHDSDDDPKYTDTAKDFIELMIESYPDKAKTLQPVLDVIEEAMRAKHETTFEAESVPETPLPDVANVVPEADSAPEAPKAAPETAESAPETKVEKTVIPHATGTVVCKNWGSNALFVDGSEFYYKVAFERQNSAYECDEDMGNGEIYKCEGEYYVYCHAELLYATDDYCGSSVSCELAPKYNKKEYQEDLDNGLPLEGIWFIDKNGYYHPGYFKDLIKTSDIGKCKGLKYIKCEPGTLAYEYEIFNHEEPLIPLTPGIKVYEVQEASADDPFDMKKTVSKTGNVWCYHKAAHGPDDFVDDLCVDAAKGPSSFNHEFSGGSEYMQKGSMRPIPKKK